MPGKFYERLGRYFDAAGSVLRGEADAASIFPNASDVGQSREMIYADFLRNHVPANCDVSLGGFAFDLKGFESKQLDIILTTNSCQQFVLQPAASSAFPKRFTCIDGTLAVVSVKSNLTSPELRNALDNLASIPFQKPLQGQILPQYTIEDYEDWPFKVIYATDGVLPKTLLGQIRSYYLEHPEIPLTRQPNLIHVLGKYKVQRILRPGEVTWNGVPVPVGTYLVRPEVGDVWALQFVVNEIQKYASAAQHILFKYDEILNSIPLVQDPAQYLSIPPRK